jgi:hypothetical protein
MPTEQELNEWTKRSIKEGMCGIVNCFNIPTTECKKIQKPLLFRPFSLLPRLTAGR